MFDLVQSLQNLVDPVWKGHEFLKALHALGRHFRIGVAIIVLCRLGILEKLETLLKKRILRGLGVHVRRQGRQPDRQLFLNRRSRNEFQELTRTGLIFGLRRNMHTIDRSILAARNVGLDRREREEPDLVLHVGRDRLPEETSDENHGGLAL